MKRSITLWAILFTLSFLVPGLFADPGTGTLFGTDANGGNFITVNPATGAGAVVAFLGIGPTPSLATDPTTGIIYAGTGTGNPNLWTVTPLGVAAFVGNTGLGFAAVGGMDFRADGTLFAAVNIAGDGGTGSDHLATLNKANGQATIIGPFGICVGVPPIPVGGTGSCTIEGIEAIAFDAAGNLWGAKSTRGSAGAPGLYSINPATGAAAFVVPILDAGQNPPSGGVVSLQFACDGTLYGGTARGIGAADGGFLVTINPLTGLFSFVGGVSATGGSSLGALAFELPCEGACEPLTQGYWTRQCLGAGLISPGRNGRGPQEPIEPDFDPDLIDCAAAILEGAPGFSLTCEDGMDAQPPNDKCEKALKQLTALVLNVCSGRLDLFTQVDVSAQGCSSTNVNALITELGNLINADDCQQASACAAAVNEDSDGDGSGDACDPCPDDPDDLCLID